MKHNYLATWFYKENAEDASFYPQAGTGDSPLTHSIYMQILVPFFTTFRHFNPELRLMFFTNVAVLPKFLNQMFDKLDVEVVRLDYTCKPPEGWYSSWMNQFYLYDILDYMQKRMDDDDVVAVSDSDVICLKNIDDLFEDTRAVGSALYAMDHGDTQDINGLTLRQMAALYKDFYGEEPSTPLRYYGGDFVALRRDEAKRVCEARVPLWEYNLKLFEQGKPKLNEEALLLSVLAERLGIRNGNVNCYFKRMWTHPHFNTVEARDADLAMWHLPYEKKRGLHYLYKDFVGKYTIDDEEKFRRKAAFYNGIPKVTWRKKAKDLLTRVQFVMKRLLQR